MAGFWDHVLAAIEMQISAGFVPAEHLQLILTGQDPDALLDRMADYVPPGSIVPVPDLPEDLHP